MARIRTSSGSTRIDKSSKTWLAILAALTVLAILTGGVLGSYLVSTVKKAVAQKNKADEERAVHSPVYPIDTAVRSIEPVVTNLSDSGSNWIRLESSIVFSSGALKNPDVTAAEIRQDIMAYLRTVSLTQIQGASGLQHLREDLNERVALRSNGLVRELIVESLVVQ